MRWENDERKVEITKDIMKLKHTEQNVGGKHHDANANSNLSNRFQKYEKLKTEKLSNWEHEVWVKATRKPPKLCNKKLKRNSVPWSGHETKTVK